MPSTDPVEARPTPEERKAIHSLQRLAASWPSSLTLASMAGRLVVLPSGNYWSESGVDPDAVMAHIDGIPNTGGDW